MIHFVILFLQPTKVHYLVQLIVLSAYHKIECKDLSIAFGWHVLHWNLTSEKWWGIVFYGDISSLLEVDSIFSQFWQAFMSGKAISRDHYQKWVCTWLCALRSLTLHKHASTHYMCISSHQDNNVMDLTKMGFPGKQVLGWHVYQCFFCPFCDAANEVIIHKNIWQNLGINYKLNMRLKGS
jgi:hypothetical protein